MQHAALKAAQLTKQVSGAAEGPARNVPAAFCGAIVLCCGRRPVGECAPTGLAPAKAREGAQGVGMRGCIEVPATRAMTKTCHTYKFAYNNKQNNFFYLAEAALDDEAVLMRGVACPSSVARHREAKFRLQMVSERL